MRYPNRDELVRIGLTVFAVYLGIYYWSSISHMLVLLLKSFSPVLMGASIAYIACIPMSFFERKLAFMEKSPHLVRLRRPVSLLAGIAIVLVALALLLRYIAPEMVQSMRMLSRKVPVAILAIRDLFKQFDMELLVDEQLEALGDWDSIQVQLSEYLMSGAGGFMGSLLNGISSVMSSTLSIFLSIILAIYILMGKERLGSQLSTLIETYLGDEIHERFLYVRGVVDHAFHNFIVGRCLVSLLLGVLCTGGMLLFRFPYAMTIGTVVGVTYVVPVVGGYVGAIIGALLIFSVSPLKALGFILFVLVLEQFEANVIFPHVVGSSTGLPGIWVLAAVAVGGELGGIPFILLSVPIAASIYQLIGDDLRTRRYVDPEAAPEAVLAAEATSEATSEEP